MPYLTLEDTAQGEAIARRCHMLEGQVSASHYQLNWHDMHHGTDKCCGCARLTRRGVVGSRGVGVGADELLCRATRQQTRRYDAVSSRLQVADCSKNGQLEVKGHSSSSPREGLAGELTAGGPADEDRGARPLGEADALGLVASHGAGLRSGGGAASWLDGLARC